MDVGGQGRSDTSSGRDPEAELKLTKLYPCVLLGGGKEGDSRDEPRRGGGNEHL